MILRRKPKPKMGLRTSSQIRSASHLKFVRGYLCVVAGRQGHQCADKIHAHHVQSLRAIEAGMGLKVGDDRTVPLCSTAHDEVHNPGQTAFEKKYAVDLEKIAADIWAVSPSRWKIESALRAIRPAPSPTDL